MCRCDDGAPRQGFASLALLLLLIAAGTALGSPKSKDLKLDGQPVTISAEALPGFSRRNPEQTRFGPLVWQGGLVLTSAAPAFGGWSGLEVSKDGEKIAAVSDMGSWLTAILETQDGKPVALRRARMGPLLKSPGTPLSRRRDIDAESLVLLSGTLEQGKVLVSFERHHRIAEMSVSTKRFSAPRRFIALPPGAAQSLGANEGLETIALLRNGAFAAIAEHPVSGEGPQTGWIWGKGKAETFHLTNPGGYSVTDAKGLDDGGLLVLERRFRPLEGVKMRLRHIRAEELRPGAPAAGDTLIEADMGYEIDNMECLAVHADGAGGTVITLMSDDNFQPSLQRTILLRFSWKRERTNGARPRS